MKNKKILFLSNHFITLYSFRKELIARLLHDGYEVYISIPADPQNCFFAQQGCHIIETKMSRRGMNPVEDLKLISQYKKMMKVVKPDIIFSYTIKPNIYGCIASNALHLKQVCNVTGTGATFMRESFLSKVARMLYRVSIKKAYTVFFQNSGDKDYFVQHGLVKDNWDMLPGSGVNLDQFVFQPMPTGDEVSFIFIGRVMKLKGIDEYLECAKAIRSKYPNTRFYIVGWNEEPEYTQIIELYQNAGYVEYMGFQKNISEWIRKCQCTVLPSHGGEGIPNVLLESAATGRVCIASKINGSIDVVNDGVTGYLFEAGNAADLSKQIKKFLQLTSEEKTQMGQAGRSKVEREFSRQVVINKYITVAERMTETNEL